MLPSRFNCPKCNCPKCNRLLAQCGELALYGQTLAVFQCDECLRRVDFDGASFEVALTFALDEHGGFFDSTGERIDPAAFN